ncbi:lytic transglycosylase domain-containing protein [Arthrobacter sp. StoSoilA2]|uniref:lytic transglycosylase domain-containing protein n=1 Tax=Arthrobacter sp. StoSoilA2 TaxID=2830990 RepID=UPI001CC40FD9|nr:lytic transglycosylase domain-containing protein [Arthrobacter sp. StoSoilA2]
MTTPRSPKRTMSMPVIAATTAALPAVVLSSLALAQPATAAPAPQPRKIPATLAAAMKAQATKVGNVIPAQAVAATLPAALRPMAPAVPDTYKIVRGDTISAIARRFNLDTAAVLQLNKLTATTLIYPGQTIKLTGTAPAAPEQTPAPAAPPNATTYTVVPGDTLGAIAARHGVPLSSIFSWNNLGGSSIIYPGQKIKVSGGSSPSTPPAPAPAPAPAATPVASTGSYTIKAGDTLSSIASRHNVSLSALMSVNTVSATTVIYPGQKLTIPGTSSLQPAGETKPLVPSTFLGFTYPPAVVSSANENKALLNASPVPSRDEMKSIVADTARRMGVSPSLALAFAEQESGFDQRAVSPANAIGTMQVIPSSGQWASDLVGRKLNLLDPYDNATAGVAIIRALIATSKDLDNAIAGYYQGQYSVSKYGMYDDTKRYVESIKARQRTFG